MARASSRSIVGSYATVPVMKKPKRVFKTTTIEDADRIDPEIQLYAFVRTIPAVLITVAFYFLFRWCGMSELWAIIVGVSSCTFSMVKADAKQFGNRFTVTRFEELTPDTPTRFKDASGKTLTIKDVL